MILIISYPPYRATFRPLKPATSRRKFKLLYGLGYILGFLARYVIAMPLCFMENEAIVAVYTKFRYGYINCIWLSFLSSSFDDCNLLQNRSNTHQTELTHEEYVFKRRKKQICSQLNFFVCVGTVLCYGVGIVLHSI